MSNELVPVSQNTLIPSNHELSVYQVMAKQASDSKFFNALGGEAGIATIMLYARELGVPPMQAITGGLHNIQGKIEISARMINTKIRQAGHALKIIQLDNKACTIVGKRADTGEEYTARYTIDDAAKAGLIKPGGNWTKSPEDMLFARCISRLGRRLFPDVIGTAYVEGEVKESMDASPAFKTPISEPPSPEPKLEAMPANNADIAPSAGKSRRRTKKFAADPAVFGVDTVTTCGATPDQMITLRQAMGEENHKAIIKARLAELGQSALSFLTHDEAAELINKILPPMPTELSQPENDDVFDVTPEEAPADEGELL